jgi:protein involved in polysaccharide export with SLBB domain
MATESDPYNDLAISSGERSMRMTQTGSNWGGRAAALFATLWLMLGPTHAQVGLPAGMSMLGKADAAAGAGSVAAQVSSLPLRADLGAMSPSIRSDDRWDAPQGNRASSMPVVSPEHRTPLPPNEFQRFVLESTGKALPLFGFDFFTRSQGLDGLAAIAATPVSSDYRMGPGDELHIKGWGSLDMDVKAVINRDGQIMLPKIGTIALAGTRSDQVESVIRNAVGRYYRDFQISVSQGQLRGVTVYVVGQARQPGAYQMPGSTTLVAALFTSGGPNQNGSLRQIKVMRGEREITRLDLYDFLTRGDKTADIKLQDGDTIVIPAANGYVALSGKVGTAAVYELAGERETVGQMLDIAGGLPVVADPRRAYLERMEPSQVPSRSVEAFALDAAGLGRTMKNGDLLNVMPISGEFSNAVTLRGNVGQPVRTPWREGLRITDVIPSKNYLMSRASVSRQNGVLLSDDEKQQIKAGFAKISEPATTPLDATAKTGDSADTLARRIGDLVDEVNFEYAVVERVDPDRITVNLLPFNLGRALEEPGSEDNLALKPGDVITVFSVKDVRIPQGKRQIFVRIEGEVRRPGIYQMVGGDGLIDLIAKAGGLTDDAYLFGTEFYRDEVRRAQVANLDQLLRRLEAQVQNSLSSSAANAGVGAENAALIQLRLQAEAQAQKQALERLRKLRPSGRVMLDLPPGRRVEPDALPRMRLENRDSVVIPARPDFVYVLGAVNTEAALIWKPGMTVSHYLDRSGLTAGADVDEMFVLRADGSVSSHDRRWFSSLTGLEVQPGDVIVLPEKSNRESAWSVFTRNAKDITQIIYQFSLGAAAIKTLRE